MNCNDPKTNCAKIVSSNCVSLQTADAFKSFERSELSCDPSITELFHKLDTVINDLQKSVDLTSIDKKDFTFDREVIKPKDLFQLLISTLSDLRQKVSELNDSVNNIDFLNSKLNIDLSCLGASQCSNNEGYSIMFILTTLVAAYCELKNSN